MTRCGPLDVRGAIGQSRDYDALLPHTVIIEAAASLPILRRTLEESRRSASP